MVPSILRVEATNEQHRVTTFELFFDLVFVFAFTQVTEFMVHEHTWLAVVQAMTLLTMLWWAWVSYGWLSNQTHVDQGIIRLGMTVSMAAIFIVALVIPEAYDDLPGGLSGPLVLVVGYAVVRATHLALYLFAAGNDAGLRHQILITFVPFVVEIALLVSGAISGGALQTVLWVLAVTANGALTYATSRAGHWRVHSAAHWGERYGLVIILAIGESIAAHALFTARMLRVWRFWRIAVAIALLPLVALGPYISALTALTIVLIAMVLQVIVEPLTDRHPAGDDRSRLARTSLHSASATESGAPQRAMEGANRASRPTRPSGR
jgi:low temperature requirement protein LtrA